MKRRASSELCVSGISGAQDGRMAFLASALGSGRCCTVCLAYETMFVCTHNLCALVFVCPSYGLKNKPPHRGNEQTNMSLPPYLEILFPSI